MSEVSQQLYDLIFASLSNAYSSGQDGDATYDPKDAMAKIVEGIEGEVSKLKDSNVRLQDCLTAANMGDVPAGWDAAIERFEKAEELYGIVTTDIITSFSLKCLPMQATRFAADQNPAWKWDDKYNTRLVCTGS